MRHKAEVVLDELGARGLIPPFQEHEQAALLLLLSSGGGKEEEGEVRRRGRSA